MDEDEWLPLATLAFISFGVVGCLLSLLVFTRSYMRTSSVNILLCALSLVDLTLLLLTIPTFVLPRLHIWASRESFIRFVAWMLKCIYPFPLMAQTVSTGLMLFITIERWTAVCRPLHVRAVCTPRKSRFAILGIVIFAILYNIPRFLEYSIGWSGEEGNWTTSYAVWMREPVQHPVYMLFYYTALYVVSHFVIPFSCMAFMNGHVCIVMWRLRKARKKLTTQQQREHSTTIMLLVVTVLFAVCNTLPFILNFIECIRPSVFTEEETAPLFYRLNDFSTLLVVFNSSSNLVIYLLFSQKYRLTLLFLFKQCFLIVSGAGGEGGGRRSTAQYAAFASMSRTLSMRAPTASQQQQQQNSSAPRGSLLGANIEYSRHPRRSDAALLRPHENSTITRSSSEYGGRRSPSSPRSRQNGFGAAAAAALSRRPSPKPSIAVSSPPCFEIDAGSLPRHDNTDNHDDDANRVYTAAASTNSQTQQPLSPPAITITQHQVDSDDDAAAADESDGH